MVLFTRRNKIEGLTVPKIKGSSIAISDRVKYLGIILDSKLNWQANGDYRVGKATIALWQCRRAYGTSWGLSPKVLHWIYTTVVRPIVLYGSFLWNHKCKNVTVQNKLSKLQGLACKAIKGAWQSTPTASMEAMLNLTPLHLVVQNEAIKTKERLQRLTSIAVRDTEHTRIWHETL